MLFLIIHQLSKEYPALSPYDLEKRSFHDVIRLYSDVRRVQIKTAELSDPDRVIYRPAGDNWF